MHFHALPPPPALAPWIATFWRLTGEGSSQDFETVLPDGSVELIFHRGEPFLQRVGTACTRQPRALVVGDIRRPVSIRPESHTDVIGVRFRPGRAHALFPTPMSALANGITSLDELMPAGDWNGLAEAADPTGFIAARLQAICRAADEEDALHACVDAILEAKGATTVRGVAAQIGLSVRQLERKFARGVGIPAKTFARVVRFHAVAETLRARAGEADFGYSDQSHLIREFREFSGMSPGDFVRAAPSLTEIFLG
jgi:AraC-like DNA-binding protein